MVVPAHDGPRITRLHGSTIVVGDALTGAGVARIRAAAGANRVAMIADSTVAPLHAAPLAAALGVGADDLFTFPAGEASKSRDQWSRLGDAMLGRGFARDTVVVAVGGGVTGDLAGFVAATFMRGVPVIQVPTTLLAMIDAAVGGKTGVDTPAGKNLIGAFHHPLLVLADPTTLSTLSATELRNGLAEALKHALITSHAELDWLLDATTIVTDPRRAASAEMADLVSRNIAIKAAVVLRDEHESGLRKVLNVGHTIGHAIEQMARYAIPHGVCVGIGMRVEARIAAAMQLASPALETRISGALATLGLPSRPPMPLSPEAVLAATRSDKKARGARVEYALLKDVGVMAAPDAGFGTVVPDDVATAALSACLTG